MSLRLYHQPTLRDYAITAVDVTTDIATVVFDFCVRNYKRKVQPVVYPVYKAAADYTVTWVDPGYWDPKNAYF